jgi:hypothetical protein
MYIAECDKEQRNAALSVHAQSTLLIGDWGYRPCILASASSQRCAGLASMRNSRDKGQLSLYCILPSASSQRYVGCTRIVNSRDWGDCPSDSLFITKLVRQVNAAVGMHA